MDSWFACHRIAIPVGIEPWGPFVEPLQTSLRIASEFGIVEEPVFELLPQLGIPLQHPARQRLNDIRFRVLRPLQHLMKEAPAEEGIGRFRFQKQNSQVSQGLVRRDPHRTRWEDARFGAQIAKEIGRLDIGQTVVVKDKAIVAVEALEGTDETIRRGQKLAGDGTVVVKMAKPFQDMRFDVPVIGTRTIRTLRQAGAAVLAIEAGKTLIIDKEDVFRLAETVGICIIGLSLGRPAKPDPGKPTSPSPSGQSGSRAPGR